MRFLGAFLALSIFISGASACALGQTAPPNAELKAFRQEVAISALETLDLKSEYLGTAYTSLLEDILVSPEFLELVDQALAEASGESEAAKEALVDRYNAHIDVAQTAALRYAAYLLKNPRGTESERRTQIRTAIAIVHTLLTTDIDEAYFREGPEHERRSMSEADDAIFETLSSRLSKLLVEWPTELIPELPKDEYALEWLQPSILAKFVRESVEPSKVIARWIQFAESQSPDSGVVSAAPRAYAYLLVSYLSATPLHWDTDKYDAFSITHHQWDHSLAQKIFGDPTTFDWIRTYLEEIKGPPANEYTDENADENDEEGNVYTADNTAGNTADYIQELNHLFSVMNLRSRILFLMPDRVSEDTIDIFLADLEVNQTIKNAPQTVEAFRDWLSQEFNRFFSGPASDAISPQEIADSVEAMDDFVDSLNPQILSHLERRALKSLASAKQAPADRRVDDIGTDLARLLSTHGKTFRILRYLEVFMIPQLVSHHSEPIFGEANVTTYESFILELTERYSDQYDIHSKAHAMALQFWSLIDQMVVQSPEDAYFFSFLMLQLKQHYESGIYPTLPEARNRIETLLSFRDILPKETLKELLPEQRKSYFAIDKNVIERIYTNEKTRNHAIRDLEYAASSSQHLIPYLDPEGTVVLALERLNLTRLFGGDQNRLRNWLLRLVMSSYIPFSGQELRDHQTLLPVCERIRIAAARHLAKLDFVGISEKVRGDFFSFMLDPEAFYQHHRTVARLPDAQREDLSAIDQLKTLDLQLAPVYRNFLKSENTTPAEQSDFFDRIFVRARKLKEQGSTGAYVSIYKIADALKLDPVLHRDLWQQAERDQVLDVILACCSSFVRKSIDQKIADISIYPYREWQRHALRHLDEIIIQSYQTQSPVQARKLFWRMLYDPHHHGQSYVGLYQNLAAILALVQVRKDHIEDRRQLMEIKLAIKDLDQALERTLADDPQALQTSRLNRVRFDLIQQWSKKYQSILERAPAPTTFTPCWKMLSLQMHLRFKAVLASDRRIA